MKPPRVENGIAFPYYDQTIRLAVRQRGYYNAIHHAEDGSVGSDPKGERENRDGREARSFASMRTP